MAEFVQTSFAGGILSPGSFGRTDDPAYFTSLAKLSNAIVHVEGSISRRPGTQVIEATGGAGYVLTGGDVRVIPFRFSARDQYALIFRDLRLDVVKHGVVVAQNIVTPWKGSDLRFNPTDDSKPGIKFSQTGDFLVITHPAYQPYVIGRESDTEWTVKLLVEAKGTPANMLNATATGGSGTNYDFTFKVVGVRQNGAFTNFVTRQKAESAGAHAPDNDFRNLSLLGVNRLLATALDTTHWYFLHENLSASPWDVQIVAGRRDNNALDLARSFPGLSSVIDADNWIGIGIAIQGNVVLVGARNVVAGSLGDNLRVWRLNKTTWATLGTWDLNAGAGAGFHPNSFTADANRVYIGYRTTASGDTRWRIRTRTLTGGASSLSLDRAGSSRYNIPGGLGIVGTRLYVDLNRNDILSFRLTDLGDQQTFATGIFADGPASNGNGAMPYDGTYLYVGDRIDSRLYAYRVAAGNVDSDEVTVMAKPRDAEFTVTWTRLTTGPLDLTHYLIYQKVEGDFGLVGRVDASENSFTVQNVFGDQSFAPPTFRNPFTEHGRPQCSALYQQRRGFGGFNEGNRLEFSRIGILDQFDVHRPVQDDDGISAILASEQINEIRHLLAVRRVLWCMTGGAIWAVGSGQGQPFTPQSITATREQHYGCSHLRPLSIGSYLLHVGNRGNIIYRTSYNFDFDSYVTNELSLLFAAEILNRRLVDWTYVDAHDPLIVGVFDDGTAICVSYLPEREVIAASTWTLPTGNSFRAVTAVNGANLYPQLVFYVQTGSATYRLLKMDFDPDSPGWSFRADLIEEVSGGTPANSTTKWAWYTSGTAKAFRAPDEAAVTPAADYHEGLANRFLLETLPVQFARRVQFGRLTLRLLNASRLEARVVGGTVTSKVTSGRVSRDVDGISGSGHARLIGPQNYDGSVQVWQDSPQPATVLALSLFTMSNSADDLGRENQ